MIVFVHPSEAATYEKWCGPDWRVDMFGPNVEVRIMQPIPQATWRLFNQGKPIAPPKE